MGGYNFRLLDDDEDQYSVLQKLVGNDEPPASQDTTPAPLQASATDPDVADFRARLAQAQAQRSQSSGGDLSALEELVRAHENRDHTMGDIDTALAMGLDLVSNRGRGLGQITGAYVNNRDAEERQDEGLKKDLAMVQAHRKSGQDPVADLLRQQALENGIRGLGARTEHEAGVDRRAEEKRSDQLPGAPVFEGKVQLAERQSGARVKGRENQRTEMLPQIEATESGIAGARTTANTESKNETPPAITPAEQARLDLEREQLDESKRARAVAEGQRADAEKQRQRNDFTTKYGGNMDTLTAAQTLEALIGEHGDIEGVGPFVGSKWYPDALKSDKAIQEQQLLAEFQNPGFRARAGQNVTANEVPRLEAEFGNLKSTNPEVVHNAVKAIAETMRNSIKRGAVGREELAREVLSSNHLDDVLGPAVSEPAAAAPAVMDDAPASARDALPMMRGAGPKASDVTGDSGSKKTYRLRSPNKKTGTMQLSDEELQKLIAKGFEVL